MVVRILLGVLIGGAIGAVLGYFGKCSSGSCPLTANPYRGFNDRYRDIRVDDNPEPIKELRPIYKLHKTVFPQPKPADEQK